MDQRELARAVIRVAHVTGQFELRSGATSTEYFDKYQFESEPALLRAIASQIATLVPPNTQVLAGLELGGVPIVTALSLETGIPAAFVRKQAKSYGTRRFAEGADVENRRVLIVEDVVTSGGQIVKSALQLRALGAVLLGAICVIDREAGGADALSRIDLSLTALFTKAQLESWPA
jgi:orotate phosphoribosyltransferase